MATLSSSGHTINLYGEKSRLSGTGRGAANAWYAAMKRNSDTSSFALARKLKPNGRPLYRSCPTGAVAIG
jgi:hypothetical protein